MTTSNDVWQRLNKNDTWRGWWDPGISGVPELPVLAARGAHGGPTVLITGGVHGDEYEGPAAIYELFNQLDTTTIAGQVIAVPVVNVAAWQVHSRTAPTDGLDLNRLFPGVKTHEPSRLLAEAFFDRFVRACDLLVDLHSGGAR
nr:succinylglutamate desuccinylase/aspartoacylase family protein [Caldilineaceae bacterium]